MQQPCSEYGDFCSNVVFQTVDVALPVSLVPAVHMGTVKIICSGEPRVEFCQSPCNCGGFELKITQTVTYKIPLDYRAEVSAGDVCSECMKAPAGSSYTPCHYK